MFNRYWRTYNWFFQLVQFIILIAVLASFFVLAIVPLVLNGWQVSAQQIMNLSEKSPRQVIDIAMWVQAISTVGIFLLPPLLFAYFTHPKPMRYLGLVPPFRAIHWLLAPLALVSATPMFLFLAELVGHLDFVAAVKEQQAANERIFGAMLSGQTTFQFLLSFLVLALLPGIGEELFFRGILMRFAAKRSRSVFFPMALSAVLFALMHSNPYGLLSIFLAGLLLAFIYYATGSLWCGMLAHICYNGLQVIVSYAAKESALFRSISEQNHVPVSWVLVGNIVFVIVMVLLWKTRKPLCNDWSQDYAPEELIEEA